MPKTYAFQQTVTGSTGNRYVVSQNFDGTWECSCRGWTSHIPRRNCKHIREVIDEREERFIVCAECGRRISGRMSYVDVGGGAINCLSCYNNNRDARPIRGRLGDPVPAGGRIDTEVMCGKCGHYFRAMPLPDGTYICPQCEPGAKPKIKTDGKPRKIFWR